MTSNKLLEIISKNATVITAKIEESLGCFKPFHKSARIYNNLEIIRLVDHYEFLLFEYLDNFLQADNYE